MLTFNLNKFKGSFLFHRFVTKKGNFFAKSKSTVPNQSLQTSNPRHHDQALDLGSRTS
jgi:hypothetical protein